MIHIGTVYLFGIQYMNRMNLCLPFWNRYFLQLHWTSACVYLSNATATHVLSATFQGIISLNNILNALAHTNTVLAKQIHKFCVLSCHKFFYPLFKYKEKKNKSRSEATTVRFMRHNKSAYCNWEHHDKYSAQRTNPTAVCTRRCNEQRHTLPSRIYVAWRHICGINYCHVMGAVHRRTNRIYLLLNIL